jgi:hypothetical protein
MAKKGTKKKALGWTTSDLDETDLKKVKKEGFLSASVNIIFPSTEVIPAPLPGFRVMFFSFPPPWLLSFCPRISSWASVCLRCAATSAHAKFSSAHCLLHYSV